MVIIQAIQSLFSQLDPTYLNLSICFLGVVSLLWVVFHR